MSRIPVRPYLIAPDGDGTFRLTVRETRYNSQGYPLVSATMIDGDFVSAHAARTHAKEHFGAVAGDFETKKSTSS
jgi:hypothetical protein